MIDKVPVIFFIILFTVQVSQAEAAEPFTLDQAIGMSLDANEVPKQATQRVLRAEAELREAYGRLLPSFSLIGVYRRNPQEVVRNVGGTDTVIQSKNAFTGRAVAEVEIFNGQAIPLIRGAGRQEDAVSHGALETRRQLAYRVAEAYLAMLAATQFVEAAEQRVEYARKILAEAQARAGAGLAAKTDVSRARVESASADLALTEAKNTLVRTSLALQYLIVSPLPGPLTAPTDQLVAFDRNEDLLTEALQQRSDLKSLSYSAEAARLRAQAPWWRYAPSLRAQGVYDVTNQEGLSGDADDWFAALTATWVLYDGGVAAAQARQFGADAEIISLEVNQLRRSIGVEIENALADMATAESGVNQAGAAVEATETYRDEVTQRYGVGLASGLEQADANLAAFEARAALVRRQLDWWLAQLSLRNALGQVPIDGIQIQEPM